MSPVARDRAIGKENPVAQQDAYRDQQPDRGRGVQNHTQSQDDQQHLNRPAPFKDLPPVRQASHPHSHEVVNDHDPYRAQDRRSGLDAGLENPLLEKAGEKLK